MIPPSSLARLILGYLEEEGLQRTAETFQQECNDAVKDPLTQYCSLKAILEEYVEIKQSGAESKHHKGAVKVITSLWKKLDVVVGQLKYHTFAVETKVPRVKAQRTNRRGVCGKFQIAKRVASNLHSPLNHSTNLNPLFDKQEVVLISEGNDVENRHVLPITATKTDSWRAPSMQPTTSANQMPSSKSRTNYGVGVHGVSTVQQETGSSLLISESQNNADSPGINVLSLHTVQGQSNDQHTSQLPNTSGSPQTENNFRQDFSKGMASQESNHSKTKTNKQSLSPDSLVNTCPESYEPTDTIMPNSGCILAPSFEIKERSSPSLMSDAGNISNIRNLLQLGGRNYEACGMDNTSNKMEMLSKSPKRKGHSPKKRHYSNPSPSKVISIDPNPGASQPSENNLEFQQLFDDSNLDATMPLLLDTLLSTPLLPEKLAENINKVCCTKQNEATTEVVSESSQVPSRNNDASSILQDETQVPVDDILNLMEADPAFDAFFNLLSTDGVKKLSPCKESQTATTFSSLEPVSTSAVCCSTEPVSTGNGSSVQHPASSDYNIPTTSVVTESLLLLASSPSKCPSSTSITPTLESLYVVSPKEVTPEIPRKESTTCFIKEASMRAPGSSGPVHVRSLQFQDKQSVAPFGKPKKSKPGRKKHNSTKTSVKVGRQRLKKLNRENSNGQGDKLRFLTENAPGAVTVVPSSFSTIDVSAVKLLQSFASVHSNGNGSNGNGVGMKKTQGGTSVQFLQDAAIHQQVQGPSPLCESQHDYDAKIAGLSLNTSLGQGLLPNTVQPTVQKNVNFQSLLLNELGTSNYVNGVTMSQQTVLPSWTSSTPLINQQGVRQLLPRPSVHAQVCSTPLLSALVKASPTKSCIQLLSTLQSSSLAPYVPSLSSVSSPSFSSVTIPSTESPLFASLATSYVTSSSTFHSSSPTFVSSTPLNHLSLSSASSSPSSSSRLDHLSSAVTAIPPSLPNALREPSLLPPPPSSVLMPQSSLQSLPSCVSSSSSTSSMFSPSQGLCASCLPANLHQREDYHSSTQQHSHFKPTHTATDLQQSTTFDPNPSTNLQTIEQEDRKQMDRAMAIDKLSGSLAKTKTVFQEPQIIDSGEPNLTSQNVEKCVSGFTSSFKDFLGDKQTNYQESCILLQNDTSETVKNIPQDKDIDSGLSRLPRKVTCSGQRENTHINEFIRSGNNSSGFCEWERVSEPKDSIKMIKNSDRQDSCIEDRQHGKKRPADQHLKENKPKKSKGCKKSKKSKTKLLPKDFDVEKFLARLHYVEK